MKRGIIYKLEISDGSLDDIYVGSTFNKYGRWSRHKSWCHDETSRNYNFKVYQFIREHGGIQNWVMVPIESVEVKDKDALFQYERKHILELKPSLNSCVPMEIKEDQTRVEARRVYNAAKSKERNDTDHRKQYMEDYQNKRKEDLAVYRKDRYENKKEEILKKQKERYEQNKSEILKKQAAYSSATVTCPQCSKPMRRDSLAKHIRNIHN